VNAGKNLPINVPLVPYENNQESPKNIIQHYNPGFATWHSTFRKVPNDTRHLLTGRVYTDFNLLIKLNNCKMNKQKQFEPIFGSICIFTTVNDQMVRISESFHFDATSDSVRSLYPELYSSDASQGPKSVKISENSKISSPTKSSVDYNNYDGLGEGEGSSSHISVNVGDGNGSDDFINKFKLTIPDELRDGDLFLVVQLNKILSCDADKAVAPYKSSFTVPSDVEKHTELCRRLIKFQQPIGLGIARINDESGNFGKGKITVTLYPQKYCLSDLTIAQVFLYN
jgi:hypothetical protein